MKILITGGFGYIGTNLYNYVNRYRNDVIFDICDYSNSSKCGIGPLAQDIKNVSKYNAVVHLAALSGLAACENDPVKAVRDNILSAQNIFKLCTQYKIPVVFTSSQAAKDPKSSLYASIKWTVEKMAESYNQEFGSNYVIRLANVYGGDQYLSKKQTCVKQFITKFRQDEPLLIHGDGKQIRDFVHVWDVCKAIMKIIEIQPKDKSPMDIGTGIGTSIMDLLAMFPKRKFNDHYKFVDSRIIGTDSSVADISIAENRIDFKAERKLNDYIKEMLNQGD